MSGSFFSSAFLDPTFEEQEDCLLYYDSGNNKRQSPLLFDDGNNLAWEPDSAAFGDPLVNSVAMQRQDSTDLMAPIPPVPLTKEQEVALDELLALNTPSPSNDSDLVEDIFKSIAAAESPAPSLPESRPSSAAPKTLETMRPMRMQMDALPLMSINVDTGAIHYNAKTQSAPVPKMSLNPKDTKELIRFLQKGGSSTDDNEMAEEKPAPKKPTGIERLIALQQQAAEEAAATTTKPNRKRSATNRKPPLVDTMPKRYNVRQTKVAKEDLDKATTKQAVYARWYRQKNKDYIEHLEGKVSVLTSENDDMKSEMADMKQTVIDMKTEISYLRGVLANSSALAPLLSGGSVANDQGTKLQFPFGHTGNDDDGEADEATPMKRARRAAIGGGGGAGVCVHVVDGRYSLELCGRCNRQARCVDVDEM